MQKIFVLITTNNPDKATRAAQFAKLAAEREALAGIMLVDDAVFLADAGIMDFIKAVTGDGFAEHIVKIPAGIPMLVCKPCCHARSIEADDFYHMWQIGTGGDAMGIMTQDGVTTLTF